jgi:hypothetical protein
MYVYTIIPKGRVVQNSKENFCDELHNFLTDFARHIC